VARAWWPADGSGMHGARERAAGEGNRAGTGRGRRVDVILAGGGAAAAAERRPEAKDCRRQESRAGEHVREEEEEEREGVLGAYLEISETSRTTR
jgi:hypothetical protein